MFCYGSFFNSWAGGWQELNNTIRMNERLHATLGNVEVEATGATDDAGCGCGYPEYVSDGVVERSNHIVRRCTAALMATLHWRD